MPSPRTQQGVTRMLQELTPTAEQQQQQADLGSSRLLCRVYSLAASSVELQAHTVAALQSAAGSAA